MVTTVILAGNGLEFLRWSNDIIFFYRVDG